MADYRPGRRERALAKRDPTEWHGQRIVTETDLGAVFASDEAERSARNSRRIRHGVVLVLLAGLVGAAAFTAVGINRGDIRIAALEPTPRPTETCPAGPFDYQDPSSVTVNVYNSTDIEGLAGTAAGQLRERAFVVAEVGNRPVDPTGMTAIIVSGPEGEANAFTLQRTIPESVYVVDRRKGRTIDVVLGSAFTTIAPAEGLDTTPGGLTCLASETPAP
ncbi:LytR C-terminal domain-containing protein [Arthrobacter sp. TMN-37]